MKNIRYQILATLFGGFVYCATPSLEAAAVVSFLSSTWTSGAVGNTATTQNAYVESLLGTGNTGSTGTATIVDASETVTVTFTGSFHGSSTRASSGSQSLGSFENSTGNPEGFIFGSNDNNSSTLTVNDTNKTISGTIVNYQRWDFLFSKPVILSQFRLLDVDSNTATNGFRDIVAAERFTGTSVGTPGTGIDATLSTVDPLSQLYQSAGASFGTESINAIIAPLGLGNPSSTPPVNVNVDFGSTPMQAFSLYTFSDRAAVHRLSLEGSGFEIVVVPEPSAALLVGLSALGLLRRRR